MTPVGRDSGVIVKGTGRGSVICDLSGLEQRGLAAESGPGQLLVVHTQSGRDY